MALAFVSWWFSFVEITCGAPVVMEPSVSSALDLCNGGPGGIAAVQQYNGEPLGILACDHGPVIVGLDDETLVMLESFENLEAILHETACAREPQAESSDDGHTAAQAVAPDTEARHEEAFGLDGAYTKND